MQSTITLKHRQIRVAFDRHTYFKFCQSGGRLDLLRVAAQQWYQCCLLLAAVTTEPVDPVDLLDPTDRTAGDRIAGFIYEGWADFLAPIIGSGLADETESPAES
tara:strand:+ start:74 stop:385 length:312 start_codon:yes stop_codon:yes gene_type:complete